MFDALMHRHEVWDLILFLFLLEYPVIARKTMSTFDCLDVGDRSVLAEDTLVYCYEGSWNTSSYIALAGIVLFCFGLPCAIWSIARTGHEGSPAHRRLAHVLTWIYDDKCWYYEVVDLARKFILCGVCPIIWRGQRAQIVFGAIMSLFFFMMHVRQKPYRDPVADKLQFFVLWAIMMTYMFAALYHANPEDAVDAREFAANNTLTALLVLFLNLIIFFYLLFVDAVGIRHIVHEMSDVRMMWTGE